MSGRVRCGGNDEGPETAEPLPDLGASTRSLFGEAKRSYLPSSPQFVDATLARWRTPRHPIDTTSPTRLTVPALDSPATVSALRDADRGTRLGVGTRFLTAVVGGAAADRPVAGSDLAYGGPPGRPRRGVDRSSLCRRRATAGQCALARRASFRAHRHVVRAVPAYPLGADGHVHCPTAARARQGARQGRGCLRSRCSVHCCAVRTGRAVDRRMDRSCVRFTCCTASTWRSRGHGRSTHSAATTQPMSTTRPRCMLAVAVCPARSRSSRTPTCPRPGQPSMSSSR